ncbi:MAG: FlgT C-terminal domain-containing protein, partial [Candidatus Omnitrophota bacterium]
KKTPLGKATQIAIDRAVDYIAGELSDISWKGKVVTVKNEKVYINSGSNAGLNSGMTFSVWRKGENLTDPETGIQLGAEKEKIADIQVTEVHPKYSKAKVVAGDVSAIERSDLVLN